MPPGWQMAPGVAHAPLLPHATVCPQLFTAVPHSLPAHVVVSGCGTQPHAPCALQVRPLSAPQPPQSTVWLQLF